MSYVSDGAPVLFPANDHRGGIASAIKDLATANIPDALPFKLLWQSREVLWSEVPWDVPNANYGIDPDSGIIYEAIVDLAQWGLVASQNIVQPDAILTKLVNGARVATVGGGSGVPGAPPNDTQGLLGVEVGCQVLMPAGRDNNYVSTSPVAITAGMANAYNGPFVGRRGVEIGNPDHANLSRYLRFFVRRNDTVIDPADWATISALGLGIHFNLTGPDSRVVTWTFPIPAAQSTLFADQTINLRDYALGAVPTWTRFLFEIVRNDAVIRSQTTVDAYHGEVYDPPTYPIGVELRGIVATPMNDYEWNPNNSNMGIAAPSIYGGVGDYAAGAPYYNSSGAIDREAFLPDQTNYCTNALHTLFRLRAWRLADDGDAQYTATRGGAPQDIPADAKDGCALRVSLLRCGPFQRELYPFNGTQDPYRSALDEALRLREVIARINAAGIP